MFSKQAPSRGPYKMSKHYQTENKQLLILQFTCTLLIVYNLCTKLLPKPGSHIFLSCK
jgi:hypothetical protein